MALFHGYWEHAEGLLLVMPLRRHLKAYSTCPTTLLGMEDDTERKLYLENPFLFLE